MDQRPVKLNVGGTPVETAATTNHGPSTTNPPTDSGSMYEYVRDGGEIHLSADVRGEFGIWLAAGIVWGLQLFLMWNTSTELEGAALSETTSGNILSVMQFAILPLCVLLVSVHRLFDKRYIVQHDEVISEQGICSFKKKVIRLSYDKVRGVEISANVFYRLLGIGDIHIATPFIDQPEIKLKRIADPARHQELLHDLSMGDGGQDEKQSVGKKQRSSGGDAY